MISLLQIWHYYVLSKYDAKSNIKELLDSFGSDEINPIILAGFVKEKMQLIKNCLII